MINLYDGGAYLVNGMDIIPDNQEAQAAIKAKTGKDISREFPELGQCALYCVSELTAQEEMDALADALEEIIGQESVKEDQEQKGGSGNGIR